MQDRKPLIDHVPNYDQKIKEVSEEMIQREQSSHDQNKVLEVSWLGRRAQYKQTMHGTIVVKKIRQYFLLGSNSMNFQFS